jgi:hypothetical protein
MRQLSENVVQRKHLISNSSAEKFDGLDTRGSDAVKLDRMIETHKLEFVEETRLPQDPTNIYTGYID